MRSTIETPMMIIDDPHELRHVPSTPDFLHAWWKRRSAPRAQVPTYLGYGPPRDGAGWAMWLIEMGLQWPQAVKR